LSGKIKPGLALRAWLFLLHNRRLLDVALGCFMLLNVAATLSNLKKPQATLSNLLLSMVASREDD
jgi:hypothetical protein